MLKEIKEIDYDRFMARRPNKITTLQGVIFYEHPIFGEDEESVAVLDGVAILSGFYGLPDLDYVADIKSDLISIKGGAK